MANRSNRPTPTSPTASAELGLRFLRARRAQNLSGMQLAEQSLRVLSELQRAAGPSGTSLAALSTAQASAVRSTADVYRVATAWLVR